MTHPAEAEGQTKASALKDKLAGLKSGGNGQSDHAVPTHTVPTNGDSKDAPAPSKKRAMKEAAPVKKEPKKEPKKIPAKTPAKAPAKEPAPRKAKRADGGARTMDRDKEGDGLRPMERDIMKIVKQRRGKAISIREIAIAIHGETAVTKADEGSTKDNKLVRTVRNGIRKPRDYGMLKLWTETGDPNAKNGYVVLADGTFPVGAGTKAKKSAKASAKDATKKSTPKKSDKKSLKKS